MLWKPFLSLSPPFSLESNEENCKLKLQSRRKLRSTKVFPFKLKRKVFSFCFSFSKKLSLSLSSFLMYIAVDLGNVSETPLPEIAIIFLCFWKSPFTPRRKSEKYEIDFFSRFLTLSPSYSFDALLWHMCYWTYINGMCVDVCTVIFPPIS